MYINKKSLQKTFIKKNSTIKDCVNSLNVSGLQIVNVINETGELIGTITDGDIRRGLLDRLGLKSSIKKILNKTPITSNIKISTTDAEKILKRFEIIHLPILKKKRVVDLYCKGFSKSKVAKIDNKVIIMAGGYGKRLGKLTKNTPKGMLKLNGKPLLQHIIEGLKNEGFFEICISTYFKKDKIKKFFEDGKKFGVKIEYLEENIPMGTIGSVGLLNNLKKPFFVINCDVITSLNFQEMLRFHISNKSLITMAIKSFEFMNPYGVVYSKKNKFIGFREKPISYFNINAGIYLFNPAIIKIIKKNKLSSIVDLFKYLKKIKKKILTFSMYENWIDYGLDKKNLKV